MKEGDSLVKRTDKWAVIRNFAMTGVQDAGRIEDLFSKNDFKKLILKDENEKIENLNSDYLKKKSMDKVLLSRQFNAAANNLILDIETSDRIKILFEKLEQAFDIFNPDKAQKKSLEKFITEQQAFREEK